MKIKQKIGTGIVLFGLILGLAGVMSAVMLPGYTAFAQEPDPCESLEGQAKADCEAGNNKEKKTCPGPGGTAIIPEDVACGDDPIENILLSVLGVLTAGVGVVAVGGIAYGAFLYTTAQSSPEQTKRAIGIITNVVVGIILYAVMFIILNFLIPGQVFQV